MCLPGFTVRFHGDRHDTTGFSSKLHLNVEPASLEENANFTLRLVVLLGGASVIEVAGPVESSA